MGIEGGMNPEMGPELETLGSVPVTEIEATASEYKSDPEILAVISHIRSLRDEQMSLKRASSSMRGWGSMPNRESNRISERYTRAQDDLKELCSQKGYDYSEVLIFLNASEQGEG